MDRRRSWRCRGTRLARGATAAAVLFLLPLAWLAGGCDVKERLQPRPDPQPAQQEAQVSQEESVPQQQGAFQKIVETAGTAGAKKEARLMELPLPAPTSFTTAGGKKGWKLEIPGGRPLATPAVADGILYVGGGFGSFEFYALDARTGKRVWTFQTGDDGPTAAVVDEGCVAYNTESCIVYVHDARTGKLLWNKWLGDPLMSQPAISRGRLFMAYPGTDGSHHFVAFTLRTGQVLWDRKIAAEVITAPVASGDSIFAATTDGTLYRFRADDGKPLWSRSCNATSAPLVAGGKVYFSQRAVKEIEVAGSTGEKSISESTLEGFNEARVSNGALAHEEPQAAVKASYLLGVEQATLAFMTNATNSALAQAGNRVNALSAVTLFSKIKAQKGRDLGKQLETYQKKEVAKDAAGGLRDAEEARSIASALEKTASGPAATAEERTARAELGKLSGEIRKLAEKTEEAASTAQDIALNLAAAKKEAQEEQVLDSSVGFSVAPATAKVGLSLGNIGQGTVKAIWAYQGSRPCLSGSSSIAVQGARFRALDPATQRPLWERRLESTVDATRPATPPALAGGKIYLGTADGRVLCADPASGKTLWEEKVGGRILFQPAVADGRVYLATNDGTLICLETGDTTADGWTMWGGSAGHNGPTR